MATKKGVAAAGGPLDEDWERLVTFYAFPKEHWKHLTTANVVESPFAAVRLDKTSLALATSDRPHSMMQHATATT